MSWLDTALEKASEPVVVDVRPLNIGVDEIQVLPLSVNEYNGLKANPELRGLSEEEKTERLGFLMVFEMMLKCDSSLTLDKFNRLPLTLIGELTQLIMGSMTNPLE